MKTMKGYLGTFAAVSLLLAAGAVSAAPIQGAATFSGNWAPQLADGSDATTATAERIAFVGDIAVNDAIGDFDGAAGTTANYTDFTFDPFTSPIAPLWTFTVGETTFSFDLESVSVSLRSSTQLGLEGMGTVRADGYDDTPMQWTFSGDSAGGILRFSAAAATVPEPSVVGLLGLGLIAMGAVGVRRRNAARKA